MVRKYSRTLWQRLRAIRRDGLLPLNRKLLKYLPRVGLFVEVGANDGIKQSNTLYLEHRLGWRGILIEPIPELYDQCSRNRPLARVFHSACSDPETAARGYIPMTECGLMSIVDGTLGGSAREMEWIHTGESLQDIKSRKLKVPCRTLSSILDECGATVIDFLSIDVEGHELSLLRGLDLSRHRPRFILVETIHTDRFALESLLGRSYRLVAQLTATDVLYTAD